MQSLRERPCRLKPPSKETLERRQREQEESDRRRLLPANLLHWHVTNSGTFGVIFTDGVHAMKVSIEGMDASSSKGECEKEIMEMVIYKLASQLLAALGTQVPRMAQLLKCFETGFLQGEREKSRGYVIMELLRPDPALPAMPKEDGMLLSVQLGQPDLSASAGSIIEGPSALVDGKNVSVGWRNMNGAVFAQTVGRDVAEEALRNVGFLHGYLETFGVFLHDSEMIWGSVGHGPARLYVIDFDKAILDASPAEIARQRSDDPVFPKPGRLRDYWGAVFWSGWDAGQLAASTVALRTGATLAARFKDLCLVNMRQGCTEGPSKIRAPRSLLRGPEWRSRP